MFKYENFSIINTETGESRLPPPWTRRLLVPLIDYYPHFVTMEELDNYADPNGVLNAPKGARTGGITILRQLFKELGCPNIIEMKFKVGYRLTQHVVNVHKKIVVPSPYVRPLRDLLNSHPNKQAADRLLLVLFGTA